MNIRELVGRFDWLLGASIILLLGVSLATLYSIALGRQAGDTDLFEKQLILTLLALAFFFGLSFVEFHTWESTSRWLYLGTLGLLVATLLVGDVVNGTRGWISLGGFRFQPVEFVKLTTIIVLAGYFSRRARALNRLSNLLQSVLFVALLAGLVFLQPDFGSAMLLFLLWFGMVLIIGVERRFLIGLVFIGVALLSVGWLFLFKPYQKERLLTFFSPAQESAASYNVRQATIAVGAGGLTGRGLGEGSQSQLRFLPEAETDFIFAVVAEQLGFAGVAALLLLIATIFWRLFALIRRCSDWFAAFLVLGTIVLFATEIFVNAGMAMGLFPVVGIPFPFLSAGGSSLVAHAMLFGIVENIARREGARGYQVSRVGLV